MADASPSSAEPSPTLPAGPLISPGPIRRALLRGLLFGLLATLTMLVLIAEVGANKQRFALLFAAGLGAPAALCALPELRLERWPRLRGALLAIPLAGLGGLLGVLFALGEAKYLDAVLGGLGVEQGLLAATEMLERVVEEPGFLAGLALPFATSALARLLLRDEWWAQPVLSLMVAGPLAGLLAGGTRGGDGRVVLALCWVGAVGLPLFATLAGRVERRLWPPEPFTGQAPDR